MDRIRELNRHSREVFRQIKEGVPPRPHDGMNRQQDVRGSGGLGEDAVAGDARLLPPAFRSPEFGLPSKCVKLLLDMSRRRRRPRQNKLAIGNSSMVIA
jgi:hypothetical protein